MSHFLLVAILAIVHGAASARAETLTVFAASSMKSALDEIAGSFEAASGHDLALSYAGSSVLARQIQLGAPADVFISANSDWMDVLDADGLVAPGTRRDVISNTLVLIAPSGRQRPGTDLAGHLSEGRVAMALVEAVPAGIYGRAALTSLGFWPDVAPRVVQADNARAALAYVALGEADLGIVYGSDAAAEPRVTVLATFPPRSHPPIRYPAAALAGHDTPAARAFLAHLTGAAAQAVFLRRGFVALAG